MQDADGIKESLKKVKEMGYSAVQLSGIARMDVGELRETLDMLGLKAICTHIPYESMKNNIDAVAAAHKTLGCEYAGVGYYKMESAEEFVNFAKEFDELAKRYRDKGIKLTYHNHMYEFEKFGGKSGYELLAENSNEFFFLLDTYWVQSGGGDVAYWIKRLKDRIEIIHFKDMGVHDNKQIMKEVGYGNLNWDEIIKICEDIGVTYAFVEQDNCNGNNPFDSLKMSYDFLAGKGIK